MDCEMYCPSCAGRIMIFVGPMVQRTNEVNFVRYAACVNCSLVSELDGETGELVDLGLSIAEIDTPFVPGMEPAPYLKLQTMKPSGRRDS